MDSSHHTKFPRTPHLPWSAGGTADDERLVDTSVFRGQEVVVLRKMDGENFTGYPDGFSHARSLSSGPHPTRDWARAAWGRRAHLLPEGMRVNCENMWAVHSLAYTNLPGYLLGFAAWNGANTCLPWDDTKALFDSLSLPTVEVVWRGVWDTKTIQGLHQPADDAHHEGLVVRLASAFPFDAFPRSVAKYVRPQHVQTDRHWRAGPWTPNGLASNALGW
jgi:RNA ligase